MQNVQALHMLQLLGFQMLPAPIPGQRHIGMLAPPANNVSYDKSKWGEADSSSSSSESSSDSEESGDDKKKSGDSPEKEDLEQIQKDDL